MSKLTTTALMVGSIGSVLQETSDSRRKARKASQAADDAQRQIDNWDNSGDKARLLDPIVRDLHVGLSIPQQPSATQPSAFAATSSVVVRPALSEGDIGHSGYPVRVNQYNGDGELVNPTSAVSDGGMVIPGLALSFDENRAMLLGQTLPDQPSQEEVFATFRHYRGLVSVLRELESLSQDAAKEAWRRFFSQSSKRLLWNQLVDSPTIGNHTIGVETYTSFVLPKNSLAVGETLEIEYAIRMAGGVNCTMGPLIETGAGVVLWAPYEPYNPNTSGGAGSHTMVVRMRMTRRADDSSGGRHFAISGEFVTKQLCASNDPSAAPVITLDTSVDQTIVIRNSQAVADMNSYIYRGRAEIL